MDKGYVVIYLKTAVLRIKKELLVLEYKDRSYIITCCRHVVNNVFGMHVAYVCMWPTLKPHLKT